MVTGGTDYEIIDMNPASAFINSQYCKKYDIYCDESGSEHLVIPTSCLLPSCMDYDFSSEKSMPTIRPVRFCRKSDSLYGYKYLQMQERRCCAASVVVNNSTMLITGGRGFGYAKRTTEFIYLDKPPVQGPKLPFYISKHSMIQVDSKTILMIAGEQCQDKWNWQPEPSNKTWILDPSDNYKIVREGPTMNKARRLHSSAKMLINEKEYIVVAGGCNMGNTVELLEAESLTQEWSKDGLEVKKAKKWSKVREWFYGKDPLLYQTEDV